MKSYCKIKLVTKSGRTHTFEYGYNTHEIMKSTDLVMHILSLPYLCVAEKEGHKVIVPRDAIDSIAITGEGL